VSINIGGAQSFAVTVKRHGIGLKIHERFVRESTYPWINYWLRLAGNALARHKEEYIFSFITQLGTVVYDNSTAARLTTAPIQPVRGTTTGRNYKGLLNGSMTLDDVFDMYAQVMAQGFIPDTLLVHPMTWLMWVKDPVLREFAIQAGGGSFFANWEGILLSWATSSSTIVDSVSDKARPVTTRTLPRPVRTVAARRLDRLPRLKAYHRSRSRTSNCRAIWVCRSRSWYRRSCTSILSTGCRTS